MNIAHNFGTPEVAAHDERQLEEVLTQRDARGGAQFWLSEISEAFPCLVIVVSGDLSFTIYLPHEAHPGFRCLRLHDESWPADGSTNFVWDGCDPASGEAVPNEFVLPFPTSLRVAHAFLLDQSLPDAFSWFEL